MGIASKVTSVVFRLLEVISAAVVAGMVGQYLHYVSQAHDKAIPEMIYAIVLAGISLIVALVCMPPLRYAFWGFVLDACLFICWMTAFGLLVSLNGGGGCNSYWYYSTWGYYWGGYYTIYPVSDVTSQGVGNAACGKWGAAMAWSFIGGWFWLLSAALGLYVFVRNRNEKKEKFFESKPPVTERNRSDYATGPMNDKQQSGNFETATDVEAGRLP